MWLQAHTAWEVSGAVNLKMKLKMTQKFREKPADSLQIYAKKMYNNYFKVPSTGLMWLFGLRIIDTPSDPTMFSDH
jgi:hypothetical protein